MDFDLGIVVPLYNKEEAVFKAVNALLTQTVRPSQVVVVNDGCTDRSVERLAPLADRITLLHKINAGCAAARNTGIAQLRTEWVAIADADDVWYPNRIELLRDFIARHPDVDWLSGQYRAWYPDGRQVILPVWQDGDAVLPYFEHVEGWEGLHCPETLVIRRRLLEEIGGFCSRLRCFEVTLMFLELALRRPRMGFLGQPTADFYLSTPSSLYVEQRDRVETLLIYTEEMIALHERFAPTPPFLGKLITRTLEDILHICRRRGDYELMRDVLRAHGSWLRRRVRWQAQLHCGLARLRRAPARTAG
jgi:glycosyltransferase involved in cell wall biosynthesis